MRKLLCGFLLLVAVNFMGSGSFAQDFIAKDGKGNAEIIISEKPERAVKLAVLELQNYIKKISGAEIPVSTAPSETDNIKIYIGKSKYTDDLGINREGLIPGGFKIKNIGKALVLFGYDKDFTYKGPVNAVRRNKKIDAELMNEWDKLTDNAGWTPPGATTLWKLYSKNLNIWMCDECGSLFAAHEFLRDLGVRWYMPGDLGEILPDIKDIALPKVDKTVNPDFMMRRMYGPLGVVSDEYALWEFRMGLNRGTYSNVGHGVTNVTRREEFKKKHPECYALYNGKRATDKNHACFSSEELFKQTVAYVRKVFDIYDLDMISVMPNDGFTAICQCPLCKDKATYDRGYRGRMSDYVWNFVNRVAIELEKTHPNKKITCCAYGSYWLPPLKIKKLNKNIVVGIVGGRRPTQLDPAERKQIDEVRTEWTKIASSIFIFENYPFLGRGEYRPLYAPHSIAKTVNEIKGVSIGEDVWFSLGRDPMYGGRLGMHSPGFYHLNIYTTARFYWGGKDKDVDKMLEEYYRLFYGPAKNEMKTFIEYCEANWVNMEYKKELIDNAFSLIEKAEKAVDPESVYGKRIALVAAYMEPLKSRKEQLSKGRSEVPQLRARRADKGVDIKIDGNLDDAYWKSIPHFTGRLKEIETGRKPVYNTLFKVAVSPSDMYLAIRCEDEKGRKLNSGTTTKDDPAIWYGDCVEVLIETDSHSYYQMAINPAGALADLDRKGKKQTFRWDSNAEVATQQGDGFWTLEMRIPYTENNDDPFHVVSGRKPSPELPWYINICRQRIDGKDTECSGFSPTGKKNFHEIMKFAKFFEGRSKKEKAAMKKK